MQRKSDKTDEVKRGGNPQWIDEIDVNVVQFVKDLPPDAGIYITGYGSDLIELEKARKNGIPVIDNRCPKIILLDNTID